MSSLLKTFAVALVLKTRSWRKDIAFLLNYMRVQSCRSLENLPPEFLWCQLLALVFTLAVHPDIPALLGLLPEGRLLCLFSGPSSVPIEIPCPEVGIHHLCFLFLLWEILTDVALLSSTVIWCQYRCNSWICFSPIITFLPGLGSRLWGRGAGFVPRCVAAASLGLVGTRLLLTSSLAVHQRVTANLR